MIKINNPDYQAYSIFHIVWLQFKWIHAALPGSVNELGLTSLSLDWSISSLLEVELLSSSSFELSPSSSSDRSPDKWGLLANHNGRIYRPRFTYARAELKSSKSQQTLSFRQRITDSDTLHEFTVLMCLFARSWCDFCYYYSLINCIYLLFFFFKCFCPANSYSPAS